MVGGLSTLFGYTKLGPQRYRERFGLAFEDFIVGQIFDYRPDVTITQQDNLEWKQNLRVNTLALQRLFGMTSRTSYRRSNLLGVDESATTGPVFGGDTLYARTRVIGKAEGADANAGVLDLVTEGINQRQEIVARIRYRIDLLKTGRHPEDWLLGNGTIAEEERFRSHHPTADGALVEQTSLYFEDFVEGETFEHWPGKWISAAESAVTPKDRWRSIRAIPICPMRPR